MFWRSKSQREHYDTYSNKKQRSGDQNQNNMPVVVAIHRLADETAANRHQNHAQENKKSRREWVTIILILLTAGFAGWQCILFRISLGDARDIADRQHKDTISALALAGVANDTSAKTAEAQIREMTAQSNAMRDQIVALKAQAAITRAQTRANLHRIGINHVPFYKEGSLAGFVINPIFQNSGATDARQFQQWWKIIVISLKPDFQRDCPPHNAAQEMGNPNVVGGQTSVTLAAQNISIQDAQRSFDGTESIYLIGHLQYRDIFFPESELHVYDWCVLLLPNDIEKNVFSPISIMEDAK